MFSWFRSIDKRYALGFLIGILSAAFAIYAEYFRDRGPNYSISIQSEFDVFSVKEDLPELQVTYDGIDLRAHDLKLHVVSLDVQNNGAGDLPITSYDPSELPGVIVSGAKVLKVEQAHASNEYLEIKFIPDVINQTIIEFPQVMLDSGDIIRLKLLLLAESKTPLSFRARGKVLGVPSISLRRVGEPADKIGFWKSVSSGSFLIHGARAISYVAIVITVMLTIGLPTALISSYIDTRKRRRMISDFKGLTELQLTEKDDFIFHLFEQYGEEKLLGISRITESPQTFERALQWKTRVHHNSADDDMMDNFLLGPFHRHELPQLLLESGFVLKQGEAHEIDEHMAAVLATFIRFLKTRGVFLSEGIVTTTVKAPNAPTETG